MLFCTVCSFRRFAIMCGIMTDYDTIQNKIKNGYIFKVRKANGSASSLTLISWILIGGRV